MPHAQCSLLQHSAFHSSITLCAMLYALCSFIPTPPLPLRVMPYALCPLIPPSHRGVGIGPYGPEAAFPLLFSVLKPHYITLCPSPRGRRLHNTGSIRNLKSEIRNRIIPPSGKLCHLCEIIAPEFRVGSGPNGRSLWRYKGKPQNISEIIINIYHYFR